VNGQNRGDVKIGGDLQAKAGGFGGAEESGIEIRLRWGALSYGGTKKGV